MEKCPEDGFHGEEEESHPDCGEEDEDEDVDVKTPLSSKASMMKEVMSHTRHFVSMTSRPEWQFLALDAVAVAVKILRPET